MVDTHERDRVELDLTEVVVFVGQRALALEDLDEDDGLVVCCGGQAVMNKLVKGLMAKK